MRRRFERQPRNAPVRRFAEHELGRGRFFAYLGQRYAASVVGRRKKPVGERNGRLAAKVEKSAGLGERFSRRTARFARDSCIAADRDRYPRGAVRTVDLLSRSRARHEPLYLFVHEQLFFGHSAVYKTVYLIVGQCAADRRYRLELRVGVLQKRIEPYLRLFHAGEGLFYFLLQFNEIGLSVYLANALGDSRHAFKEVGVGLAHFLQFRGYADIEQHLFCALFLRQRRVQRGAAKLVGRGLAASFRIGGFFEIFLFHAVELAYRLLYLGYGPIDLAVALGALLQIGHLLSFTQLSAFRRTVSTCRL